MVEYEKSFLKKLESDLEEYEKIFLILGCGKWIQELTEMLFYSETIRKKKQKVLVLSSEKRQIDEDIAVTYRQITDEEMRKLHSLYFMYEFSNRFLLISEEKICGGLLRYVDTGLLCLEEVLETLLY